MVLNCERTCVDGLPRTTRKGNPQSPPSMRKLTPLRKSGPGSSQMRNEARERSRGMRPAQVDYSTVTDLARLRGWSTSSPLTVASSQAKICSGTTVEERRVQGRHGGHAEDDLGELVDGGVSFLCDDDRAGTAGADLGDVGQDLAVQLGTARGRHDDDDRLPLVHQSDGAVLELAQPAKPSAWM